MNNYTLQMHNHKHSLLNNPTIDNIGFMRFMVGLRGSGLFNQYFDMKNRFSFDK